MHQGLPSPSYPGKSVDELCNKSAIWNSLGLPRCKLSMSSNAPKNPLPGVRFNFLATSKPSIPRWPWHHVSSSSRGKTQKKSGSATRYPGLRIKVRQEPFNKKISGNGHLPIRHCIYSLDLGIQLLYPLERINHVLFAMPYSHCL